MNTSIEDITELSPEDMSIQNGGGAVTCFLTGYFAAITIYNFCFSSGPSADDKLKRMAKKSGVATA